VGCDSVTRAYIPSQLSGSLNTDYFSQAILDVMDIIRTFTKDPAGTLSSADVGEVVGANTNYYVAEISTGVLEIGSSAFYGLVKVIGVNIGPSVVTIGLRAFSNCYGITDLSFGTNNALTTIGERAFFQCTSITSPLIIPNSVTSIGYAAFYQCSGITDLSFGTNNALTTIGSYAFQYCESITSPLIIPNSVTSIGSYAFNGCTSITPLIIPDSVTSIGVGSFVGCDSVTRAYIPSQLSRSLNTNYFSQAILDVMDIIRTFTKDPAGILSSNDVGEVVDANTNYYVADISTGVVTIGTTAFSGSDKVIGVKIGPSVETIGASAFENCSGITDLTIGESVRSIGNGAFSGCDSITSISIPDSVTSIGNGAFDGCVNATSITIGASVRSIGESAFYGCVNVLNTITLLDQKLTSIGASAFYNTGTFGISTIDLSGSSAVTIGASAFFGVRISNVTFPLSITIGQDAFRTFKMLSTITFQRNSTSINGGGITQFAFIEPLSEGGACSIYLPSRIYLASLASGQNNAFTYPPHLSTKSPSYVRRVYHIYLDEFSSSAGPITTSQNGLLIPMLSAGQVTNEWYGNVSMPVMTGASITQPSGVTGQLPYDRASLALNPGYTVIESPSPTNPNGALSSSTYEPPGDLYVHNSFGTVPALRSVNNSIFGSGVHFTVFFNNQLIRAIRDPD